VTLLIAVRHFDAQYSWNAHDKKALAAGVSAESIKELANNEPPHFAHPDEQLLYSFATQILRDHFVDQETFSSTRRRSTAPTPGGARRGKSTSSAAWATSPCWRCCSTPSRSTSSRATSRRSPTCAASPRSTPLRESRHRRGRATDVAGTPRRCHRRTRRTRTARHLEAGSGPSGLREVQT
jgi:hypothetical protein